MRGIFRITSAEFNKIFKKPTVYIMALVLVFACLISLFTFNPTPRTDERVKLTDESATSNYSLFLSNTGNDTKNNYDKNIIESDKIIVAFNENYNFYQGISQLESNIKGLLTKFENNSATPEEITKFKESLLQLSQYFNKTDNYYIDLEYYKAFTTAKSLKNDLSYIENEENKLVEIYKSIEKINDQKVLLDTLKNSSYITTIANAFENYKNYIPFVLNSIIDEIKEQDTLFKSYLIKVAGTTTPSVSAQVELGALKKLTAKLDEYKNLVDQIVTKNNRIALISSQDKTKLDIIVKRVVDITTLNNHDKDIKSKRQEVATRLNNDNYINQLYAYNDLLKYIDYSDKTIIDNLNTLQKYKNTNQEAILTKIDELKNATSVSSINEQITNYKLMASTYGRVVENTVTSHIVKNLSANGIKNLYNYDLKSYNEYNQNTSLMYDTYYLKNNVYSNSYLNTFNYNQTIDYETTAYDYIFSTLKICTLLIIIFTMMMSAYLISSECDSGTIKLLLMRPFNRGKILSAKMLATLFFSLCFMLLSLIITFVGGLVSFGLPTLSKMLVVFNSTTIFQTTPLVMLLIYLLTAIFDIILFLILSYFVSIIFKSFAASISTSFITILLTIVLSLSLTNTIAYAFIPLTNISWFRYFGVQQTSANPNIIESILSTPIQSNMSIWISIGVLALTCAILYLITYSTFKKRDY